MFGSAQKVFFVGIGGIGISAIARMFLLEGRKVSGSDIGKSEVIDELRAAGAEITIGQSADLVPKDTDLIVYTIAIEKADPALFDRLKGLGISMLSYPETLEVISRDRYTIAISGTHGKTTTTAMVAKILIDAGLDPTVIVGSLLKDTRSNFIAGKSKYFVVEACEYRRSFLNIHPTIAVITNIDDDHLDYYKDLADIATAFKEFVSKVPREGLVVCDPQSPYVKDVIAASSGAVIDYTSVPTEDLRLKVPGKHNLKNAQAALSVAQVLGISLNEAKKSLEAFAGTWRRFEHKGEMKSGSVVYDDYGHHPTEISATIQGAREAFPGKKITVVFQPHLFSRTKQHLGHFAESLARADRIILADIYPAREPFDPSVSSRDIVERIKKINPNALYLPKFGDIVSELAGSSSHEDVVITMGAGETNRIAEMLIE